MNQASTLTKLKSLEPSLRAQGICGLHVFGSQARGDIKSGSDVDLMFEIAPGARFSLFDQARIARQISELLEGRVDFVPRRSLHPLVAARAKAERVAIFS